MRVFPPISPSVTSSNWAYSSNTDEWNIRGLYEAPDGVIYRCILAEDANISQYDCLAYATNYGSSTDGESGEVTNTTTSIIADNMAGGTGADACAGVAAADITDANIGFAVVSGLTSVNAAGSATDTIVAGDNLVLQSAGHDGSCAVAVAKEEHVVFGVAVARESGDVVLAHLRRIL